MEGKAGIRIAYSNQKTNKHAKFQKLCIKNEQKSLRASAYRDPAQTRTCYFDCWLFLSKDIQLQKNKQQQPKTASGHDGFGKTYLWHFQTI